MKPLRSLLVLALLLIAGCVGPAPTEPAQLAAHDPWQSAPPAPPAPEQPAPTTGAGPKPVVEFVHERGKLRTILGGCVDVQAVLPEASSCDWARRDETTPYRIKMREGISANLTLTWDATTPLEAELRMAVFRCWHKCTEGEPMTRWVQGRSPLHFNEPLTPLAVWEDGALVLVYETSRTPPIHLKAGIPQQFEITGAILGETR